MSQEIDQTESAHSNGRRWAIVALIAGIGALAALPFRRGTDSTDIASAEATAPTASRFARASDLPSQPTQHTDRLPPSVPFAGHHPDPEPLPTPEVEIKPSRPAVQPPAIPAAYEPLVAAERPEPAFLIDERPEAPANILPQQLRELSTRDRWPVEERASATSGEVRHRTYRIRDGDTLASIAYRYLGNQARAGEIYELNRERLYRPDILPLGETILLPTAQ